MARLKFSANLGFLWSDLALPQAIRSAKRAGFDAVECHFPYVIAPQDVVAALKETGLPMMGINTVRGGAEDNGLAALPGREAEARAAIDQAVDYAVAIDARNVHVTSGFAEGAEAHTTLLANLRYARDHAPDHITLLIEPLNRHDAPGYFLKTTDQACGIIETLDLPGIKLMFDCYHVARTEGDVTTRLRGLLPIIGHIQFASVPDRGAPDHGEIDYRVVFDAIRELGWSEPLGAEYKTGGDTEATLDWLRDAQSR